MGILKNMMVVEKKPVPVLYDADFKVSFDLLFLSKSELQTLLSKHTKTEFNPRTHQPTEKVKGDDLTNEVIETCVKGWSGVTYEWLAKMLNLDISKVVKTDLVPFSMEDMKHLVKETYALDSWILDTVRDAANFSVKEVETKN